MEPLGSSAAPVLRERAVEGESYRLFVHEEWIAAHPGLVAGVTGAAGGADFGLSTVATAGDLLDAHAALGRQLEFSVTAVVRQKHGSRVATLRAPPLLDVGPCGSHQHVLVSAGDADGLLTRLRGVLLTVTAADCVPVYLLEPSSGALGLLHAGWRGVAAGILEEGFRRLCAIDRNADRTRIRVHLGPAICGACYEVGPEVERALGRPAGSGRADLRACLRHRAVELGVKPENVTTSLWCTRCDVEHFHSHRGTEGRAGRMAAFLGRRADPEPGRGGHGAGTGEGGGRR